MLLFWSLPCFCFEDDVILVVRWMRRWRTRCSPPGRQVLSRCIDVNCSYPFLLLVWLYPSRVYRGCQWWMYVATAPAVRPVTVVFRRVRSVAKSDHYLLRSLPVRVEQLCSNRTDFREIWYLMIVRKSVEKVYVSLKSDKNGGCFTRRQCTKFITLRIWEWETF